MTGSSLTLALFLLALPCAGAGASTTADVDASVDRFINAEMSRSHIPGAAVAVISEGKLVKLKAYGIANLESGALATVTSAFQIASATKLYTSILLMDQVAQGTISLDAPISTYLGKVPPAWSEVTVRQLASHVSGMAPAPPNASITSLDDALALAMKVPLASAPGTTNAYGSDDFTVLTAVLERASGSPFQHLLHARISKPLALSTTRFDNARLDGPHIVLTMDELPGRVATYEWKNGVQQRYAFLYPTYTYAAGGLFSSITDMAAFVGAVLDERLLVADLREQMWKPVTLSNGKAGGFATGWTVGLEGGRRKVGHSGGPALSDVVVYPDDKLAVIVLTNQRKLYPNLAQRVARHYLPPHSFTGSPAIPDDDPALATRLASIGAALSRGQAPESAFAASARPDLAQINEWLQLRLGGLPTPSNFELLETAPLRVYRARHGNEGHYLWKFKLDAQGLIEEVDVTDE